MLYNSLTALLNDLLPVSLNSTLHLDSVLYLTSAFLCTYYAQSLLYTIATKAFISILFVIQFLKLEQCCPVTSIIFAKNEPCKRMFGKKTASNLKCGTKFRHAIRKSKTCFRKYLQKKCKRLHVNFSPTYCFAIDQCVTCL